MKRFTVLFDALDETNKTADKVVMMAKYFREAPAQDAAWGLFFLAGQRLRGAVKTRVLREAALIASGQPAWMLDECYEAVGDLSETVALLLPPRSGAALDLPLHVMVQERIASILGSNDAAASKLMIQTWNELEETQRLVFNKLIRGNFRLGVQRALVVRALAQALGVNAAVLSHRLSGGFVPSAEAFTALGSSGAEADTARPYPFCLAHQLDRSPAELGATSQWQIEFKWDGIRAQVIRRAGLPGGVAIWSRGEEPIAPQFPELAAAAAALPAGTVLDGEILAWRFGPDDPEIPGRPLSFNALQTRLNRKNVQASLFDTDGVVFAAFDVLEHAGQDVRSVALRGRRALLESLIGAGVDARSLLRLPGVVTCQDWSQAQALRASAREAQGAEGLMLKHLDSHYHPGRVAGGTADSLSASGGASAGWWKWKVDPYSVDAVLMYAQQGSGKRAGLYTDYTFGVWDPAGQLVAFAKAYSGLDNEEIRRVDAFVRGNTLDRRGPVRIVRPELVFEISFESIRESPRHRAGIAVRFPRITRWRTDKAARDADTVERLRALLKAEPV